MQTWIRKYALFTVAGLALTLFLATIALRGIPKEAVSGPLQLSQGPSDHLDLPFFGVFARWPTTFLKEPVFIQIPYHKGPPKKFIERMDLVFKTNVATLEIHGPKTIDATLDRAQWRNCYSAWIRCRGAKSRLKDSLHPKVARGGNFTWLKSESSEDVEGLHAVAVDAKYRFDEYFLFEKSGTATHLLLQTAQSAEGAQGFDAWTEVLSTLRTVPISEFKTSADWAGTEISRVRLKELLQQRSEAHRILALAKAQMTVASRLSVLPTQVDGFFHFGGISHLLAIELLKLKPGTLKSQESFFQSAEPNLLAMQSYIRDFGARSREEKNIEALIQDLSSKKK